MREFLGALTREATARQCGVLLIAHSTKAARGAARDADRNEDNVFNPGAVGGSAHWTDGVRGVLTLTADPADRRAAVARPSRSGCSSRC